MAEETRVIILTGPVGSGKTTLLNCLLQMRPSEEQWAVLVNDIGKTEVEKPVAGDVEVRTMPGACMSGLHTGVPLRTALLQMLKRKPPRPHYLFIEQSTLGEPNDLRALFQTTLSGVAAVHSVIAVVSQERHLEILETNTVYRVQLEQADILAVQGDEMAGSCTALPLVQSEKRMFWKRGLRELSEDVASAVLGRSEVLPGKS